MLQNYVNSDDHGSFKIEIGLQSFRKLFQTRDWFIKKMSSITPVLKEGQKVKACLYTLGEGFRNELESININILTKEHLCFNFVSLRQLRSRNPKNFTAELLHYIVVWFRLVVECNIERILIQCWSRCQCESFFYFTSVLCGYSLIANGSQNLIKANLVIAAGKKIFLWTS